ncbi:hypothetical protein RB195_001164 [Necator americanus]|uniref:Uncharacterized protein n=1 Tax=Necator americanus TaxID=51031 RepID=A0ABR1DDP2_NECAM
MYALCKKSKSSMSSVFPRMRNWCERKKKGPRVATTASLHSRTFVSDSAWISTRVRVFKSSRRAHLISLICSLHTTADKNVSLSCAALYSRGKIAKLNLSVSRCHPVQDRLNNCSQEE